MLRLSLVQPNECRGLLILDVQALSLSLSLVRPIECRGLLILDAEALSPSALSPSALVFDCRDS